MSRHFFLRLFFFGIHFLLLLRSGFGQPKVSEGGMYYPLGHSTGALTFGQSFSTEEQAKGSPWFSPVWLPGQVNFSDGYSLPQPGEVLYLNYNKSSNRLYCKNQDSFVEILVSGVSAFRLNDSTGIHSFVKLPEVSNTVFFEELTDDPNGFILYRKRISRLHSPDYMTSGFISPGKNSALFMEDSEYFLFYPDGKKILRFYLSDGKLRRKLSRIGAVAEKFMEGHPGRITHQMLLRFCDLLNENPPAS